MANTESDPAREERISREVFVDAYTPEEQALCWYYYLENKLNFPFQALWENETVEVIGMDPDSEDAGSQVQLQVLYREGELEDVFPVLVTDLQPVNADEEITSAIADLHYWVNQGNQ